MAQGIFLSGSAPLSSSHSTFLLNRTVSSPIKFVIISNKSFLCAPVRSKYLAPHPPFPHQFSPSTRPASRRMASRCFSSGLKFFEVSTFADSAYWDAMQSIKELQRFDGHVDVFVCIAHDLTPLAVSPFLNDQPNQDLNDRQEQGLKKKAQRGWLNELPRNGKPGRVMYGEVGMALPSSKLPFTERNLLLSCTHRN
jgi:hypothetical protein